jgi:N-acetylglucosamine kinase-like BadF-type ATPase
MSKKKRRNKRNAITIEDAIAQSVDQSILRSAAAMSQQLMDHALKTDPKSKSLLERIVKERIERALRKLSDKGI